MDRPEEMLPEEPWVDPVVQAYKKDVDRTLLRENLKLTPDQRLRKLQALLHRAEELRRAGRSLREAPASGGYEPDRVVPGRLRRIRVKRTAERPEDLEVIAGLEALAGERLTEGSSTETT